MIFSEERANVAAAYTKAWGKITTPKRNKKVKVTMKTGGSYNFEYTDLTGIFDAIKKLLAEHEIGVMQDTGTFFNEKDQPVLFVQTMLIHSTGEYIQSEKIQLTANNSIQDFGGQISYLKRYQLSAMMGLSTETDDDANGASGNQATYQDNASNAGAPATTGKPKVATEKQQKMIHAKLKAQAETENTTPEVLYSQIQQHFGTTAAIENLNPTGASKIIEFLMKKEKGESI